jgi:AcrR family transcriptional regulator
MQDICHGWMSNGVSWTLLTAVAVAIKRPRPKRTRICWEGREVRGGADGRNLGQHRGTICPSAGGAHSNIGRPPVFGLEVDGQLLLMPDTLRKAPKRKTSEAVVPRTPPRAPLEPLYAQLPARGRRKVLGHDAVASNQRSRLIGAMIQEAGERGYAEATLARLVALAGVSKRAFHEQFGSKEAYFLATYDAIVGNAVKRIGTAYRSEGDWQTRLGAAFGSYAAEVVEEPKAARLVLLEALGAGPTAAARIGRTRVLFEDMVATSFGEVPDGIVLPPLIVKGIVCGIERVTRQRLLAGDVAELPTLADELLAWALCYRSAAAGRLTDATPEHHQALAPCCLRRRVENDRARILRCAAQIAASTGYSRLTPAQIVLAAGVSEAKFHELFESREQCFLDAIDRLGLEALVCAARAFQCGEQDLAGVHRGIAALMRHIASTPVLIRVAFVESFALGPAGFERRERLLGQFTDHFVRALPKSRTPSRLAAEASVGAVWGIIHHLARTGRTDLLPALVGQVSFIALAPVIGGDAAVAAILAAAETEGH